MIEKPPEAAGVMYSAGGRVLMAKRAPDCDAGSLWAFPAGMVEAGETPEAAARREFFEETGYQIPGKLSLISYSQGFSLFAVQGELFTPSLCAEHTESIWADPVDLPQPLHPGIHMGLFAVGTDRAISARIYDINGWPEIKRNPISKVGVFPYLGSSIGAPDPDKIYMVYRPAEELGHPECIESFKMIPLIDDHEMLGNTSAGLTPPEQKIMHGMLGQEIAFQNDTLYGNLKIISQHLNTQVDENGKRELSAGYRCSYDFTPGSFQGQAYDAVQRNIRGNHIALVFQGRMGPDVAVLDHADQKLQITFDAKELLAMTTAVKTKDEAEGGAKTDAKKEMTLAEAQSAIEQIMPMMVSMQEAITKMSSGGAALDEEEGKEKKDKEEKTEGKGEDIMDQKTQAALQGLDSSIKELAAKVGAPLTVQQVVGEVSRRDKLAAKLVPHVGSFACDEMSVADVAKYGVTKLKIPHQEGHEAIALDAYLFDRPAPSEAAGFTVAVDAAAITSIDKMRDNLTAEPKN